MSQDKPKVLFVDDEWSLLQALRRAFAHEAFEGLYAQSAEEALAIMEQQPVRVVVADLQMPGTGGLDLHRQIATRFPETVCVLLSGHPNPDPADVSAVVQALHHGEIFRFVAKGADLLAQLEEVVAEALEHYELRAMRTKLLSD